jgi:hypothetical protein
VRVQEEALTYDTGFKWRLNLLGHQPVPVDISGEERMPLDLVSAVVTQPLLRTPLQKTSHYAPRFGRDVGREVERVGEDPLVHNVHVLVVERRQAGHHLIDQDAKSPPVNGLGIPLAFEEFRSDVFWCTTEGCGGAVQLGSDDKSPAQTRRDLLVAFSVSDIFSLHNPKSQRAMWPV